MCNGALKNIADTPFFVDSRASRLVQIADHVAYAVFRRYNAGDARYFDIIGHRFDADDNVIHGLAHKHVERYACTCPACLSRRLAGGRDEPTSRLKTAQHGSAVVTSRSHGKRPTGVQPAC